MPNSSELLKKYWAMIQNCAVHGDLQAKEILRLVDTVHACDGAPRDQLLLDKRLIAWEDASSTTPPH